jgi:hypothetical protein
LEVQSKFFGQEREPANIFSSSTMLTLFDGRIDDLTPMLTEERFTENWEPRVRSRFGLTMLKFNFTVLPVELGVDTKKIEKQEAADAAAVAAAST